MLFTAEVHYICVHAWFAQSNLEFFVALLFLRFVDDKKTKTTVVKYFREKYNVELQCLSLPALQAGSDTKPIYLPMEVLLLTSLCILCLVDITLFLKTFLCIVAL